ncbi:hypothetical protein [Paenibacillus sp. FSL E2-0178]|uniref:hypothetical protein n=1 Tax=Paenibacillus sp. FSL E2-0178 TaxID=2921361 RepID=UPI003158F673
MAVEYSLYIKGRKITLKEVKDLFSKEGIEIISTSDNQEINYQLTNFKPEIGLQITVREKGEYPAEHPANAIDTIFLKDEFIYDYRITFRHDKFYEDTLSQNRIMYVMVFEIVEYLDCIAILFGPGGEDICYFSNKGAYIIKGNVNWFENGCKEDVLLSGEIIYFDGEPM